MVKIDSVKFGEITIDGKIYYSDMVVWWDGKIEYREKSHIFGLDKFVSLLKKDPEIIVAGTGISGVVKVTQEVRDEVELKRIKLIVEPSKDASEIFNDLVSGGKKVVAVIHTTY